MRHSNGPTYWHGLLSANGAPRSLFRWRWLASLLLVVFAASLALAAGGAVDLLLNKARSLEGRGRMDLAAQTWQQVLLADPNQPEALAGMARWSKQSGNQEEARKYVERLRRVHPNDPELGRIEAIKVLSPQQRGRLDEAGRLARAGKADEAFHIYREVFGNTPPLGDWAVAYYETEAASSGGRENALNALRALAKRYPSNESYRLALGRLLTYEPKTRLEGVQMLSTLHGAAAAPARLAWRKALEWEAANPAYQASAHEYLRRYPERELSEQAEKVAKAEKAAAPRQAKPAAPAPDADEERGYKALNAGDLDEAQKRFDAVLSRHATASQALAGLGFVNMKREDFEAAQRHFEEAAKLEPQNKTIQQALESARFWAEMKRGNQALNDGRSEDAVTAFQQALALRPTNAEAAIGLAGSLLRKGEVQSALPLFKKVAEADPQNAPAWRGYVTVLYKVGDSEAAIQAYHRLPASTREILENDADLLTALALANQAVGQQMEAERMLRRATQIAGQQSPQAAADIQVQFANTMLDQGKVAEAAAFYKRVTDRDPDNLNAWQGLLGAYLRLNDYARAIAAIKAMPQGIYAQAVRSGPFLDAVAAIYVAQGQYDSAEAFLRKALELPTLTHATKVNTQLQLAYCYVKQGRNDLASDLYLSIVDENENDADAWRGYILGLHEQKDDDRALAESERMPDKVRKSLEKDSNYLALMASVHLGIGDSEGGIRLLQEARWPYDVMRKQAPANLDIQLAWAYLDADGREKELYQLLTSINLRNDLTPSERDDIRKIWSTWSLRRSQQALESGDEQRAVAILEAAAQALPQDNKIRAGLAGMFLRTGDTRRALLVYQKWGLNDGAVDDYLGAIGAAMSVQATQLAEHWMHVALQRWPKNASLLDLAGKQAAGRGDYVRAEAYWKAALENMPRDGGNDALFGILSPGKSAPRQSQATQSLARLLMPDGELPAANPSSLTRVYTPRAAAATALEPSSTPLPEVPQGIRQQLNNPTTSDPSALRKKLSPLKPQSQPRTNPLPAPQPTAYESTFPTSEPQSVEAPQRVAPARQTKKEEVDSLLRAYAPPPAAAETAAMADTTESPETDAASASRSSALPQTVAWHYVRASDEAVAAQKSAAQPSQTSSTEAANDVSRSAYDDRAPLIPRREPAQPEAGLDKLLERKSTRWDSQFLAPAGQQSERQEIEDQIASIHSRNTPFFGADTVVSSRSGAAGFDRAIVEQGTIRGSFMLRPGLRVGVEAKPTFIYAGQPDGTSNLVFGYLGAGTTFASQSVSGLGGDVQLSTQNIGLMVGMTPQGFWVHNTEFGGRWRVLGGPFTVQMTRAAVSETMLSYSGTQDPQTGYIWGGVMSTGGKLTGNWGGANSGIYAEGGYASITGHNVAHNSQISGSAGTYWKVLERPQGKLTVGMNLTGMHYNENLRYFSFGQGGYFSPQSYFLFNVPVRWLGKVERVEYLATGSLGSQFFNEDPSPYYPLSSLKQQWAGNYYTGQAKTGANYNVEFKLGYRMAPNWYIGAFANANNTANYSSQSAGFSVRYLLQQTPGNDTLQLNSVPDWKGNQYFRLQ